MASIETVFIVCVALLVAIISIFVRLDGIGKKLTQIESMLDGRSGTIDRAGADEEVIGLLREGKVNKATILYSKRAMIPLRDAELFIQKVQSSLAG